jgi:hypothetical protein
VEQSALKRRPTDPEHQCDVLNTAQLKSLAAQSTRELLDCFLSAASFEKAIHAIGPTHVVAVSRRNLIIDAQFLTAPWPTRGINF